MISSSMQVEIIEIELALEKEILTAEDEETHLRKKLFRLSIIDMTPSAQQELFKKIVICLAALS